MERLLPSVVQSVADKQLAALEIILPNIIMKQRENAVTTMDKLMEKRGSTVNQAAFLKADEIITSMQSLAQKQEQIQEQLSNWPSQQQQEVKAQDKDFDAQDALSEAKAQISSSKLSVLERQVDSLEGKLLKSVAELGGVILDGM